MHTKPIWVVYALNNHFLDSFMNNNNITKNDNDANASYLNN